MISSRHDSAKNSDVEGRLQELHNFRIFLRFFRFLEGLIWISVFCFSGILASQKSDLFGKLFEIEFINNIDIQLIKIAITVSASAQIILQLFRWMAKVFVLDGHYDRLLNELDQLLGGWSDKLDANTRMQNARTIVGGCRVASEPLIFKGRYSALVAMVLSGAIAVHPYM
jgi:hypothetical protein